MTLQVTLNEAPVRSGNLSRSISGLWSAELNVAADEVAPGEATLDMFGRSFTGLVLHPGEWWGSAPLLFVGCRGRLLGSSPKGSFTRGVMVRDVLDVLLPAIGEQLAAQPPPAAGELALQIWTRMQQLLLSPLDAWVGRSQPAAQALTNLLRNICSWRTDDQGRLLLVRDEFPPYQREEELYLIKPYPTTSSDLWALDFPDLDPGLSLKGRNITEVRYEWNDTQLRAETFYQAGEVAGEPPLRAAVIQLAREAFPNYDYLQTTAATVQADNGDGTITLNFDDELMDDAVVELRFFAPGAWVKPPVGRRCQVYFENADPSRPRVASWESDGKQARPVSREGDECRVSTFTVTAVANGVFTGSVLHPGETIPVPFTLGKPIQLRVINGPGSRVISVE